MIVLSSRLPEKRFAKAATGCRESKIMKVENMEKKVFRKIMFGVLALTVMVTLVFVHPASSQRAFQTVRICNDGTIDPASTPIQRMGDKYVFTGDVNAAIIIEKGNIVIDGSGYTLKGPYNGTRTDEWMIGQGPDAAPTNGSLWTTGIDFDVVTKPNNVTIKNLNIWNFYIGMYVWTFNNTISDNSVTENIVGILLSGDSNTIMDNNIADNDEGIFFGVNNPAQVLLHIVLTGNSFVNNGVHFSGCTCQEYNETEAIHTWDNGERGNFWSNYNGTDANRDGLGDTPYVIDIKNQDRFPLMKNMLTPLNSGSELSNETIVIVTISLASVITVSLALKRRKLTKR